MRRGRILRVALPAACAALLSCSLAGAKPADPVPDRVQVRGSEFDLILSKTKVKPGTVIVQFVNAGEDSHDLRLQRLGPYGPNDQVGPELGAGEVAPGDYENIDAHLRKGSTYVLWCSLSDHRQRGMEATLRTAKHR
jgi:plastocyanin